MLSTHIMQEVEAICDRVIIINNGKIVADDKASNLNKLFSSKNIIHIEFEKAIDEKALSKLGGVQSIEKLKSYNYLIQSKSEVDIRNDLFQFAITQGTAVLTLKKKELKLEDIFKQLTT